MAEESEETDESPVELFPLIVSPKKRKPLNAMTIAAPQI